MKSDVTWLVKLAHTFYAKPLIKRRQLSLTNNTKANLNAGPYLLMSNHVGIMDPVFISALFPKTRTIRWVTGAYLFKNKFLKHLFTHHLKCIPKQQGRSDLSTLRTMQRELKAGNIVGIYPEGTRTWDGDTFDINFTPMAKMMKVFGVPVLMIHLEGAFANQPRWSDEQRKGPVNVNIHHMFTTEEISNKSIETLASELKELFKFSNDEWKQTHTYNYVNLRRAEGIQRLFYMCPTCYGIDTVKTEGCNIRCSACNFTAQLNNQDDIISTSCDFKTISQWHKWEKAEIGKVTEFQKEKGVLFQTGNADNNGNLNTISENISVEMKNNSIVVTDNNNSKEYVLPIERMTSLVLNAKQTMELFCDNILYRIRLNPDASSIKYQEYYQSVTEKK